MGCGFNLHETLARDTVEIVRWPLCRVLLMNNSRYPWLILVPAQLNLTELHDLDSADQTVLMSEITRASQALAALYAPDKINVGALGNTVPQLHIHVIARFRADDGWPGPVWGTYPAIPYETKAHAMTIDRLRHAL